MATNNNMKSEIICKGWAELCDAIRASYPELRIIKKVKLKSGIKKREYLITPDNLEEFLIKKGFIASYDTPTSECRNAGWIFHHFHRRNDCNGNIVDRASGYTIAVSEYGFDRIVRVLQGKRVKIPQGKKAKPAVTLSEEQKVHIAEIEQRIKLNIKNFKIVGLGLLEIQSITRIKGKRWAEYTSKTFGLHYRRAKQYMQAVQVLKEMYGVTKDDPLKLNQGSFIFKTERMVRPFVSLDGQQRKDLMAKLKKDFDIYNIKVEQVEESARQFKQPKKRNRPSQDNKTLLGDVDNIMTKLKKLADEYDDYDDWKKVTTDIENRFEGILQFIKDQSNDKSGEDPF